jgi:hypothetical protein
MALDELKTEERNGKIIKETPVRVSWRCVHDGEKVLHFFNSGGATLTADEIFAGSLASVLQKVSRDGLKYYKSQFLDEVESVNNPGDMQVLNNFFRQTEDNQLPEDDE